MFYDLRNQNVLYCGFDGSYPVQVNNAVRMCLTPDCLDGGIGVVIWTDDMAEGRFKSKSILTV